MMDSFITLTDITVNKGYNDIKWRILDRQYTVKLL